MKSLRSAFRPAAAAMWIALLAAPAARGQSPVAAPDAWIDVGRAAAALGRPDLADRLKNGGFEPSTARDLLRRAAEGRERRYPVRMLLSRLDEGLAKGAPTAAIGRAMESRLLALEQAAGLLDANGYKDTPAAPREDLLAAAAMALESGLPPEALGAVLKKGQGQYLYRMTSAIEGGESLRLAGIGAEAVRDWMSDCLDRNLGRMEILRAARYAIEQHRQGVPDPDLRRILWNGVPSSGGGHRSQGGGNGGHGRGPGPGR